MKIAILAEIIERYTVYIAECGLVYDVVIRLPITTLSQKITKFFHYFVLTSDQWRLFAWLFLYFAHSMLGN